jgi:hypothetical protein
MFMSAIFIYFNFEPLTAVYVEPAFSTLKRVLPEKIRRSEMRDNGIDFLTSSTANEGSYR